MCYCYCFVNQFVIIDTVGGLRNINQPENNISDDDEPLYDAVASDDDYAALAPVVQQV